MFLSWIARSSSIDISSNGRTLKIGLGGRMSPGTFPSFRFLAVLRERAGDAGGAELKAVAGATSVRVGLLPGENDIVCAG